jgi:serine/threonine protein kinase/Tfp pilus assembly protein PilF
MESRRWEQVVAIYEKASEHEPVARAAFLAEACHGDDELQREVLSLLDQDITAAGLLESIALWSSVSHSPASIGTYRILGLIGEGGMGTVYEAEQENPRRIVALKVVKQGLAVPEVLRRFEQESRALARLQHTGIAQVYEAGVARGRPYFAMERIKGRPLLEYATARQLTTSQRLDLMIKICEATHHAHERSIIHRDLKPGNILVDESGQPKILDFGVARIADADAAVTRGTDLGTLVGTLAYMSPEQVASDPSELDACSDVYALGLILYELLAGRVPYETGRNVPEATRIIREQDPAPLRSVSREFRGDLETIVAKALEKDKARRYATAADLAADLRRHLADQPIHARPASTLYLSRKFVLRHKALAGAALAVFAVLVAGILASGWQAARAHRAEQTARAVSEFLQNDVLGQASPRSQAGPNTRPDPDLKVRSALDRAAARIAGKFSAQPEVEAAVRYTIGNAYRDLGFYTEAMPHMERALELRRRVLGKRHPDTLDTMQALGRLYLSSGKYASGESVLTELLGIRRRLLGNEYPDTIGTMNELAICFGLQGDWARSARLLAEALESERRLLGEQHPDTLSVMQNLATQYVNLGQYASAAELYGKAVEAKRRVLGADHPSTLLSMNNLAVVYRNLGKYTEAEALFARVLEARRRTEGDQHPDTLASVNSLALLYQAEGRYNDAEGLLTQALGTARRLRPDHPDTTRFMNNLAEIYWKQGKLQAAESLFREAIDARRRTLGPNHPTTASVLASLGEMKLEQGHYAEAEPPLREAIRIYEKSAPGDWRRYYAQAMLGAVLAGLGRRAEAGPLVASAYQALLPKKDSIPSEKRQILDTVQDWKSRIR